jgi:uncharacterized RDD family membrane protein YckC
MANARTEPKIDTLQSIELAEGVGIQLRTAGVMARSWAFFLDGIFMFLWLMGLGIVVGLVALVTGFEVATGIQYIGMFIVFWFYPTLYEAGKRGATPGKRMIGLRVVRESGAPITFGQSLLRNLLRAVDMLPFPYGFGIVTCLFTKKFQRLGDLVAGTVVTYSDTRGRKSPPLELHLKPRAPRLALHREEQVAITDFGERSALWSDGRRIELADQLSELTGATGVAGVAEVLAISEWLQDSKGGDSK